MIDTNVGPQLYPGAAMMIAVPLKNTQKTLNDLALILLRSATCRSARWSTSWTTR
ncbi:hypothetical protein [Streptomyces sp. S816]|uniref:hypothetical protein n=1 Tax=Streptomyces sp. S816 TaxID=2283197 RepID=UPI00144A6399|nr:hypothetical protein [Streptomyces sp. S816]